MVSVGGKDVCFQHKQNISPFFSFRAVKWSNQNNCVQFIMHQRAAWCWLRIFHHQSLPLSWKTLQKKTGGMITRARCCCRQEPRPLEPHGTEAATRAWWQFDWLIIASRFGRRFWRNGMLCTKLQYGSSVCAPKERRTKLANGEEFRVPGIKGVAHAPDVACCRGGVLSLVVAYSWISTSFVPNKGNVFWGDLQCKYWMVPSWEYGIVMWYTAVVWVIIKQLI